MTTLLRSPWLKALGLFFLLGIAYHKLQADIDKKADASSVEQMAEQIDALMYFACEDSAHAKDSRCAVRKHVP